MACKSQEISDRTAYKSSLHGSAQDLTWTAVLPADGTVPVSAVGPTFTYPWYASNSAYGAITYGADYPGTNSDYGQGSQFPVTMQCGGPYGPDSTYCDTVLKPPPLS